ncbi:transmembrane amino acid transporter protein-domain-containing protein [Naematelia encephala]|uniref:Transmembrane amino acid transporter protein-domain-containing protein n=1 Tax=Naematelia encephala TaxID=71784 RepID=A0A1Y2B0Y4_9TREE|nr:transmembrane amino acid transporter protein-domain-containing protein [Naematelia encephala]
MTGSEDDLNAPLLSGPSLSSSIPLSSSAIAGPSSRPTSRQASKPPSRIGSRRNSFTKSHESLHSRSDDIERQIGSGRSSRNSGSRKDDDDQLERERHVLFKIPMDEDGLDDPLNTVPLLSRERRQSMTDEEVEELVLAEGPNTAVRGTLLEGIANMANSIIGAGIVGLPYAVSQAGFVMGVFLLIVLAGVTDWTIRLVVVNAKLSGRDSYVDVMHHCFGPLGSASVSFFQFAFAFGGMCAFNVIIGDTIPHVISYIFPFLASHAVLRLLVDRRVVIILCTIAVSFPLSLHRDIVKLSKSSGFALVSMMIIVTSVVLRGVAVDPSLRGSPLEALSLIRPGVFEAIGVISFAFVCHHNTMFIYQSIETPTLDRFNAVTHASTGMSLLCCLLMAVTGFLVFTDKTQGNILNNFPPDDLVINIARFCFGANMSTTIPLENYVCREVIEDYFFKDRPFSHRRHVAVTALVVFSTMSISLLTCDLGVVLEIAGGLSATALAFIFPAIAFYALTRGPWYSRQKLPAVICATFGTVVLVLSCGLTVMHAWTRDGEGKVCT